MDIAGVIFNVFTSFSEIVPDIMGVDDLDKIGVLSRSDDLIITSLTFETYAMKGIVDPLSSIIEMLLSVCDAAISRKPCVVFRKLAVYISVGDNTV